MRILWIVNLVFPEALTLLHNKKNECQASGGWLVASSSAIAHNNFVNLFVVAASNEVQEYTTLCGKSITYILIPQNGVQTSIWEKINLEVEPDVVHIHGTENNLGLSYLNKCGNAKVVLSVQGIMGLIGKYYDYGLSFGEILKNLTLYDILRRQSIWDLKKSFMKRGEKEEEVYRKLRYVIGRTETDKAHVKLINPDARYFHCEEILRSEFYEGIWDYSRCEKHTIFMSQASYPVKGIHQVLKALPQLLCIYPDLKLRVAGPDFTKTVSVKERIKFGGYANYIKKQIQRNHLEGVITFTGPLDAKQMKQEYLNANIFLLSSSIENSPNSLAEAQMLGVPCLASYVGGVPDMIPNRACGEMYRFEDIESFICKVVYLFENSSSFSNKQMRLVARERHGADRHVSDTLDIYDMIINEYHNDKTAISSSLL